MKLKLLCLFFIISSVINNDIKNNTVEIELPALRTNNNFNQGYRILKTTISDPLLFDLTFPETNISLGYVLRYYFYTGIDLNSDTNQLTSMDNRTFDMPETEDPVELVKAVIQEVSKMGFGSREYREFVKKTF
tara:strand:- start:4685 stop:5083 length:399 start_codon:yes stop_codon:yes gene_type:complete